MTPEEEKAYHAKEAIRINGVLNNLSSEFAADGIVKTILRSRVEQEKSRAEGQATTPVRLI